MAYEIISIDENSWRIEDGDGMVRCFLFTGDENALLVDTGVSGGDLAEVISRLTDLPVILVNTHADEDHIAANAQFNTAYMHPAEFPYYESINGTDAKPKPIWEGDRIDLGGRIFKTILIPGHTPGSIALLDIENRVLIAGDSVTISPVFLFNPPEYGALRSPTAFVCSMEKLRARKDNFDIIYPSHGPFPVDTPQIDRLLKAAEKLMANELIGSEPPFDIPAKLYEYDGAAFFYHSLKSQQK